MQGTGLDTVPKEDTGDVVRKDHKAKLAICSAVFVCSGSLERVRLKVPNMSRANPPLAACSQALMAML